MTKVLLVIDMLNDLCDRKGALFAGEIVEPILPVIARLIEEEEWEQVIFACDAHEEEDPEFIRFSPHCLRGSWGAEVVPCLPRPVGAIYVQKKTFSAFFNTQLEEELTIIEPDEVHVVGLTTSVSVMDTVAGLAYRRIPTIVLHEDGIADVDPEWHEFAMERMKGLYGAVVTRQILS